MSGLWHYFLTKYNQNTNFSEKVLSTREGNIIIGVITLKVIQIVIEKINVDIDSVASLHCDAITSYELNENSIIEKIYTPLEVANVQLSSTNLKQLISISQDLTARVSDVKKLRFWLQDVNTGRKLSLKLVLHCAYNHQC